MVNKRIVVFSFMASTVALQDSGLGEYLVPRFMQAGMAHVSGVVTDWRVELDETAECVRRGQSSGDHSYVKAIADECGLNY